MFKKYVLSSGLRVVLAPQPDNVAATVLVLVEAGSKYETKKINGLSHFLEHLCFKGTAKRPTAIAIASELESLGAVYNAFTGHEVTGYYAKVGASKINSALDIIADLYQDPVFDEAEFEKEKGVIIEEINLYEDTPTRKVQELFTELMYGDQPAGWPIGGLKEVILSLKKQDVLNYRSEHYVAKATTVVVAGAFNEKEMLKRIKTLFAKTPANKKFSKIRTQESQARPQTLVRFKKSDQTHLVMGFRAFDRYDKRQYALEVLADILGGGMSSRLFQRIRAELGAAYYVKAGTDLFTDHGFLSVSAGVDHRKLKEVIEAALGEFKKISSVLVTSNELEKSKNHLTGQAMLGLETSDALASFYGEQEIFQEKILNLRDVIKKIEAVTAKDVLNVAREIMKDKKLNLALIGPVKKLPTGLDFSLGR
ncbi:MAG: pitrilysin family protein [bacterium]|nr:pitrilysin family protein [bacterium]